MKVHTIEIAGAIEKELKSFLADWGGGYPMRFTRFVDIGGKQTDLYVYPAAKDATPWMIVRIKSVFKTEQGECMQYFANIVGKDKHLEEVMVSPEIWKLPALADRVLKFVKNDLLMQISQGGGDGMELGGGSSGGGTGQGSKRDAEEEEDYEDLDTSGILSGGGGGGVDFNMDDILASANAGGGQDDVDPSELLRQFAEEAEKEDDDTSSGFNPEDVIKD